MTVIAKKKNSEWIKDLPEDMRKMIEDEFKTKGWPGCGLLDDESYSLYAAMGHLRHNSSGNRGFFWHGVGVKMGFWGDGKDSTDRYKKFWYNEALNKEGYDFAVACGL